MELSGNLTILSPRDQRLRHVYWVQGWGFRLVYQIISNSARLQTRKLKQNKPKQAKKNNSVFIHLLGLGYILKYDMNVKIIPCAPKGKEYDKKRKRKEEIALKMGLRVGTITILFLRRKRVHVHSELQADINYIVPTSFSVVFPALDLVPTNLLLMLFSAETRVQLALSSNAQPSDASAMFGR